MTILCVWNRVLPSKQLCSLSDILVPVLASLDPLLHLNIFCHTVSQAAGPHTSIFLSFMAQDHLPVHSMQKLWYVCSLPPQPVLE